MGGRMVISSRTLDLVYKIAAIDRYNPERRSVIEKLLIDVITNGLEDIIIKNELKKIAKADDEKFEKSIKEHSISFLIEHQRDPVFSKFEAKEIIDYIQAMYMPFSNPDICGDIGMKALTMVITCQSITQICGKRAKGLGFTNGTYVFENREEYADQAFVSTPDQKYIDIWSKGITFKKGEVIDDLNKISRLGFNEDMDSEMLELVNQAFKLPKPKGVGFPSE